MALRFETSLLHPIVFGHFIRLMMQAGRIMNWSFRVQDRLPCPRQSPKERDEDWTNAFIILRSLYRHALGAGEDGAPHVSVAEVAHANLKRGEGVDPSLAQRMMSPDHLSGYTRFLYTYLTEAGLNPHLVQVVHGSEQDPWRTVSWHIVLPIPHFAEPEIPPP
jgi:hypothetical protein